MTELEQINFKNAILGSLTSVDDQAIALCNAMVTWCFMAKYSEICYDSIEDWIPLL